MSAVCTTPCLNPYLSLWIANPIVFIVPVQSIITVETITVVVQMDFLGAALRASGPKDEVSLCTADILLNGIFNLGVPTNLLFEA